MKQIQRLEVVAKMSNYMERFEDMPVKDFKPGTGISVVYMDDDGGFRIEASPGFLIFDSTQYGDDAIDVVAAAMWQNGMPYVALDCVGIYPDEKARRLFENAKWSFYLASDPDDIEVREGPHGLIALVEYKIFVTKGSCGEAWELHCPKDALPHEIREHLENLKDDAIERYETYCDVKELTGTVEA